MAIAPPVTEVETDIHKSTSMVQLTQRVTDEGHLCRIVGGQCRLHGSQNIGSGTLSVR